MSLSLPPSIRTLIPLVIGLLVGGVGATMFLQSMPGAAGSAEERANKLELELRRAQNRLAELEGADGASDGRGGVLQRLAGSHDRRRTMRDGLRDIGADLRAGRPVTPEDIFRASQPLMRDLAPLFDRMRLRQQQAMIDSLTGEVARQYGLDPQQQGDLKQWFAQKADEEAKRWTEMVGSDSTRLQDLMRASQNVRPDAGLDEFMPSILSGEKLTEFQNDRLNERASRVEREADARVQRLDSIVQLDSQQRDQVFALVARNSKEYDPRMAIDGVSATAGPPSTTGDTQEAMLSVLRADQRAAYEIEIQRRREQAAKDMEAVGLSLPTDWDFFGEDFRR